MTFTTLIPPGDVIRPLKLQLKLKAQLTLQMEKKHKTNSQSIAMQLVSFVDKYIRFRRVNSRAPLLYTMSIYSFTFINESTCGK